MLTVLLKKKTNFRIESINTVIFFFYLHFVFPKQDGIEKVAPDYLGLNKKKVYETEEYKQLNEKSLNDLDIDYIKKESKK